MRAALACGAIALLVGCGRLDFELLGETDNDAGRVNRDGAPNFDATVTGEDGGGTDAMEPLPSVYSIGLGATFSCVIEAGALYCSGDNTYGQLGTGGVPMMTTSFVRVGADTDWIELAGARSAVCGRRQDGTLWCWGRNSTG